MWVVVWAILSKTLGPWEQHRTMLCSEPLSCSSQTPVEICMCVHFHRFPTLGFWMLLSSCSARPEVCLPAAMGGGLV